MNFSHNSSVPYYYTIDYENSKKKRYHRSKFIVYCNRNYKRNQKEKKMDSQSFPFLLLAADRCKK